MFDNTYATATSLSRLMLDVTQLSEHGSMRGSVGTSTYDHPNALKPTSDLISTYLLDFLQPFRSHYPFKEALDNDEDKKI